MQINEGSSLLGRFSGSRNYKSLYNNDQLERDKLKADIVQNAANNKIRMENLKLSGESHILRNKQLNQQIESANQAKLEKEANKKALISGENFAAGLDTVVDPMKTYTEEIKKEEEVFDIENIKKGLKNIGDTKNISEKDKAILDAYQVIEKMDDPVKKRIALHDLAVNTGFTDNSYMFGGSVTAPMANAFSRVGKEIGDLFTFDNNVEDLNELKLRETQKNNNDLLLEKTPADQFKKEFITRVQKEKEDNAEYNEELRQKQLSLVNQNKETKEVVTKKESEHLADRATYYKRSKSALSKGVKAINDSKLSDEAKIVALKTFRNELKSTDDRYENGIISMTEAQKEKRKAQFKLDADRMLATHKADLKMAIKKWEAAQGAEKEKLEVELKKLKIQTEKLELAKIRRENNK